VSSKRYLRRYTELTALIYLLKNRKITLLDPVTWRDTNDSHYLALYKRKKTLKTVLALCFTETSERYDYWSVFAGGLSGVYIQFKRSELLGALHKHPRVKAKKVRYVRLDEIRHMRLAIDDLPFLKRYAYKHEYEFRVLYESSKQLLPKLDIAIPLSCIDRITLGPGIHPDLFEDVKELLKSIDSCSKLKISRSTLIGNQEWKDLGESAT
jgi:hypothetical protein